MFGRLNRSKGKTSLQTSMRGTTYHGLAIKILQKHGKPMKVREILEKIEAERELTGKTPGNTLSAILQSSAYIEHVGFGLYKLSHSP